MKILKLIIFSLFLRTLFLSVDSEVIEWVGTFGDWNDPVNWNVSRVPNAFDDVLLPQSATNYTVFIGGYSMGVSPPAQANSLYISSTAFVDLFGPMNVTSTIVSYGGITLYEHPNTTNYTILTVGTSIHCESGILQGIGTIQTPFLVCYF